MSDGAAEQEAESESGDERRARIEAGVRAIREGHGANCSSIGSVIDTIFASAVLGGAVLAAVVASLGREKVRVVGSPASGPAPAEPAPPRAGTEEAPAQVRTGARPRSRLGQGRRR
jgi:hypothetical protein